MSWIHPTEWNNSITTLPDVTYGDNEPLTGTDYGTPPDPLHCEDDNPTALTPIDL